MQRSLSNWLIHSLELLKHELLRWCSIDLDRHTHTTHKEQKDTSKKCEEEVHFCKMAAATLNAFRSLFGSMNLGQKARLLCDSPKRKPWPKKGSSSASSSSIQSPFKIGNFRWHIQKETCFTIGLFVCLTWGSVTVWVNELESKGQAIMWLPKEKTVT